MRIIAFINQKGGVGKTTATVNVGRGLSLLGQKVMLIDIDPQAHMTYSLGIEAREPGKSVYDLLTRSASVAEIARNCNGMAVIPSTLALSGAEVELASTPGRESALKEALKNVSGPDYILIDCPPGLGLLTLNAMTTAREIFICVQTEYLALHGIDRLLETLHIVKQRLNADLAISGVICTRYDRRKTLNREVVRKLRAHFGDVMFKTMIRDNVAIAEAPTVGLPIFDYAPKSHGAEDYMNLCREITKKGE
jgi:chromosome partitioning protein